MKKDPLLFLNKIGQILFDKKGINILVLDVKGVSTLTDYFIFAEGNVDKHVMALAKAVIEALKKEGENPIHVEGLGQGDWIVIDYMDLVIHLFKPGLREKYRLEELWREGKIVDLELVIPKASNL